MLDINVAATDGRSNVNEDLVGATANAVWVMDGATGIGPALTRELSDAAWLVSTADQALRTMLEIDPYQPAARLLASVMAHCRSELHNITKGRSAPDHEHPSAAFAMVRLIGDQVEMVTLGDCRIAHEVPGERARLFGTTSLEVIEKRTLRLAERIRRERPRITPPELKELLLPQLRANRSLMNQPGGYWVLGTQPAAADHLDRDVVPARQGQRFALASDGFLRLVELFGVATPDTLLGIQSEQVWDQWLAILREKEIEPNSVAHYPRVKIHDDASLLNCTISEAI